MCNLQLERVAFGSAGVDGDYCGLCMVVSCGWFHWKLRAWGLIVSKDYGSCFKLLLLLLLRAGVYDFIV